MDTLETQKNMCYIIQRMLECVHHRQWLSLCRYCKHLFLLAYYAGIQDERKNNPPMIISLPYTPDE